MISEQKLEFENLVNSYKNLTIEAKRDEIVNVLKELLAVVDKINVDAEVKSEMLLNREILDLNNCVVSEDDYLEAVYVYAMSLQNSIGSFLEKFTDVFYE